MIKKKKILLLSFSLLLLTLLFTIEDNSSNKVIKIISRSYLSPALEYNYSLSDATDICNEINKKENSKIQIGISTNYTYEGSGNIAFAGGESHYDQNNIYDVIITDSKSNISKCANSTYYENNLSNVTQEDGYNYKSWARFSRVSNKNVYVEDIKVKAYNETQPARYTYLEIQNRDLDYTGSETDNPSTRILKSYYTLKPGERIFFDINLDPSTQLNTNNIKDLRLSINYGKGSSDVNIYTQKSITYYLYANIYKNNKTIEKKYGPFEMDISNFVNQYTIYSSNNKLDGIIEEYNIISENLLKEIPDNTNFRIDKIRFYPYGNNQENKGTFKLYSLSVNAYSSEYHGDKEYIEVNNAEDKTRHNIVDNMMDMATLKWQGANSHKYLVYYKDGRGPFEVSKNEILYGLPYVAARMSTSTIYSFLSNTRKGEYTETVGNEEVTKMINIYKTGTKYWSDTISSKGNIIEKGSNRPFTVRIMNDNFELYDSSSTNSNNITKNFEDALKLYGLETSQPEFINNKDGAYLQGVSCSTSSGASFGPEVPYKAYISSDNYVGSSQVSIVGGIDITTKEVDDILRAFMNSNPSINAIFINWYSSIVQSKYGLNAIYEAYASTLPGDLIAHPGHVELLTGRTYVECTDGTHTQYFEKGFCDNHGGINPNNSYVIKTSLGGSKYEFKGSNDAVDDVSYIENGDGEDETTTSEGENNVHNVAHNYALTNEAKWEYSLNPNYTDLTSIDEIYTNENVHAGAGVNVKRTFSNMLYGDNEDFKNNVILKAEAGEIVKKTIYKQEYNGNEYILYKNHKYRTYIPYRLKSLEKLSNNLVEKPTVKYILDKEYNEEEQNNLLYNYLKENHTLKGIFSVNYMMKAIKVKIKGKITDSQDQIVTHNNTYYMYPDQGQGTKFFLANNFSEEIQNTINNLVYDEPFEIVVSFNMGPNLDEVKNAMDLDSEEFFEVLRIKTPDAITITEKEVTYNGNIQEANITSLSNNISSITYYDNNTCTNIASPINAGTYYVLVSTTGNTDYNPTNSECTKAININKKDSIINVSKDYIDFSKYVDSIISYSYDGDGDITCEVANNSIVDCIIDKTNNKVKITPKKGGLTEVTLIASEGINYKSISKTINVNVLKKGDFDKNGTVDLTDVISILKYYLDIETPNSSAIIIGDMDNNDEINILDVLSLLRIYLGIE